MNVDPRVLATLTEDEKRELYELLRLKNQRTKRNRLNAYKPYPKQKEFHDAGGNQERLFIAGNQLGKTLAGAFEMAMHLTGRYPDWWEGRRFNYAIRAMCGSESAELTRKGVQRLLLGPPEIREEWGTGAIPFDDLKDTSMRAGVPDAVSSAVVRHVCGDDSVVQFNSYDQGRSKWQADTVDVVWFDEEPTLSVYTEGLTRTNATGGFVYTTLTPLLGMSDVVRRLLVEKPAGSHVTTMTIDDVDHYTPEERAAIIARYPEHEREARTKGIPTRGSGLVFPIAEESIKVNSFPIPPHWARIVGLDFGIDHPTAAVWMAWDRDTDVLYVTDCYRVKDASIVLHASSIWARGEWIPVAWPHDGLTRDKGSGEQLAEQYRKQGLQMLRQRATFEDGSNGVEAGVTEMLNRMQTQRFKVFSHLNDFFEEMRFYHRKDGMIVKSADDLMSAARYATIMRRFARTHEEAGARPKGFQGLPAVSFGMIDEVAGY